jgi:hypothetical protein
LLLGFDNEDTANCVLKILNSEIIQRFMKSLVFYDAKRGINKDLLMRIDLEKAAKKLYTTDMLSETEYNIVMSCFERKTEL